MPCFFDVQIIVLKDLFLSVFMRNVSEYVYDFLCARARWKEVPLPPFIKKVTRENLRSTAGGCPHGWGEGGSPPIRVQAL